MSLDDFFFAQKPKGTVSAGSLWTAIRSYMSAAFWMWRSSNGNIPSLMMHPGLAALLIPTLPAAVFDGIKGLFPTLKYLNQKTPLSDQRSLFVSFPVMTDLASVQTHFRLWRSEIRSHMTRLVTLLQLKSLHPVCWKFTREDDLFLHFQSFPHFAR